MEDDGRKDIDPLLWQSSVSGEEFPIFQSKSFLRQVAKNQYRVTHAGRAPGSDFDGKAALRRARKKFGGALAVNAAIRKAREKKQRWLFLPGSLRVKVWNVLVLLWLVFSAWAAPLRMAFPTATDSIMIVEFAAFVFFGVDILVQTQTAVYDADDALVLARGLIWRTYRRSSAFLPDIMSMVPWGILCHLLSHVSSNLVWVTLTRIVRLLDLVRLSKATRVMESTGLTSANPAMMQISKLLLRVILLLHITACMWHTLATIEDAYARVSWRAAFGISSASVTDSYIHSLYWTSATITGVGYGDVYAVTLTERWFSVGVQLLGAAIFGLLIGNMSSLLETVDARNVACDRKLREVKSYMADRRFPQELRTRVTRYYTYFLSRTSLFDEQAILSELSPNLRSQAILSSWRTVIEAVPLLRDEEEGFVTLIIPKLKPVRVGAGEVFGRQSELARELFFMLRGVVEGFRTHTDGQDMVVSLWTAHSDADVSGGHNGGIHHGPASRVAARLSSSKRLLPLATSALLSPGTSVSNLQHRLFRRQDTAASNITGSPNRARKAPSQASVSSVGAATDDAVRALAEGDNGCVVGLVSCLLVLRRVLSLRAVAPCDMFSLSREELDVALEHYPGTRRRLTAGAETHGNKMLLALESMDPKVSAPTAASSPASASTGFRRIPAVSPGWKPVSSINALREAISRHAPADFPQDSAQPDSTNAAPPAAATPATAAATPATAAATNPVTAARENSLSLDSPAAAIGSFRAGLPPSLSSLTVDVAPPEVPPHPALLLNGELTSVRLVPHLLHSTSQLAMRRFLNTSSSPRVATVIAPLPRSMTSPMVGGRARHAIDSPSSPRTTAPLPSAISVQVRATPDHASAGADDGDYLLPPGKLPSPTNARRRSSTLSSARRPSRAPSSSRGSRRRPLATELYTDSLPELRHIEARMSRQSAMLRPAKEEAKRTIHPDSPWKARWDTCLAVAIVYSVLSIPMRIGFAREAEGGWRALDVTIDVLFGLDMALNFLTAYYDPAYDEGEKLVTSYRQIAVHYLQGWFIIDFLSTFPLDSVVAALLTVGDTGSGGSGGGSALRSFKLVRVVRLIRLLKLVRLLKLGALLDKLESSGTASHAALRVGRLVFQVTFIGHLLSCAWFFVTTFSDDPRDTWWFALGLSQSASLAQQYGASMYWAFSTMTTVGYGDISAHSSAERVFASVVMLLGAGVFGFIIGSMASLVSSINASAHRVKLKMDAVREYTRERRLPRSLEGKILRFYGFYHRHKSVFDEAVILGEVSGNLRRDIVFHLNRDIIDSIGFLRGMADDKSFTSLLVGLLAPVLATPQDIIYREGTLGTEMYFLVRGMVEVVTSIDNKTKQKQLAFIEQGGYFGEIALLMPLRRTASTRAITQCRMFSLSRAALTTLCTHYPQLVTRLQLHIQKLLSDVIQLTREEYAKAQAKERRTRLTRVVETKMHPTPGAGDDDPANDAANDATTTDAAPDAAATAAAASTQCGGVAGLLPFKAGAAKASTEGRRLTLGASMQRSGVEMQFRMEHAAPAASAPPTTAAAAAAASAVPASGAATFIAPGAAGGAAGGERAGDSAWLTALRQRVNSRRLTAGDWDADQLLLELERDRPATAPMPSPPLPTANGGGGGGGGGGVATGASAGDGAAACATATTTMSGDSEDPPTFVSSTQMDSARASRARSFALPNPASTAPADAAPLAAPAVGAFSAAASSASSAAAAAAPPPDKAAGVSDSGSIAVCLRELEELLVTPDGDNSAAAAAAAVAADAADAAAAASHGSGAQGGVATSAASEEGAAAHAFASGHRRSSSSSSKVSPEQPLARA